MREHVRAAHPSFSRFLRFLRPEHVHTMRILWRSLRAWPADRKAVPATDRLTGSGFRTTFSGSLDKLEYELERIGARDVVLEVDIDERDMNRDGTPMARASIRKTPGVVLRFTDKSGAAVVFPCDRYMTWQRNVHALALTLTALRAVDRYGATTAGEQYAGWKALPAAGRSTITTTLSLTQSAELLARWSGADYSEKVVRDKAANILDDVDTARSVWHVARKRSHPDSIDTGGTADKFALVSDAARVLAAHHGVDKL